MNDSAIDIKDCEEPVTKKCKLSVDSAAQDLTKHNEDCSRGLEQKISNQSRNCLPQEAAPSINQEDNGDNIVCDNKSLIEKSNDPSALKSDEKIEICESSTDQGQSSSEPVSKDVNTKKNAGSKSTEEKTTSLSEIEAGITEYMGQHAGFSAIIKQRYSDFIVNEIDQEGNTVHLTDLSLPPDNKQENQPENSQGQLDAISADTQAELLALSQATDKSGKVNIPAPENKETRTKIHLSIKQKYSEFETKTVDENGQKFIQVIWKKGSSRNRSDEMQWPASKKSCPYMKFVLYKENKDTIDAIGLIARNLRVKEGLFQYAGTKDKRGKTTQEITAYKVHPKKLAFLNKTLFNFGLGNFRYVKEPLKLGQLKGNHFTIVLRNVQGSTGSVEKALTSLKTKGFVNYFGLQRFGTTSIPTYHVGRALLKSDWQLAVDLLLMPRNDHPDKDRFQQVWAKDRDPEATLRVLPRFCGLERNLLEALKKGRSHLNSLDKISHNTRLLYVHSYQSRVWNLMASRRLKQLGHQVVVGDLVMDQQDDQDSGVPDRVKPTVVTEDNMSKFTLKDVVLPLPGYDVLYPHNEVKDWYREALKEDSLDIDNMKRPQKDYSLPGAYRPLVVCPTNVSWDQCFYEDYTLPLTVSDLDRVQGGDCAAVERKKHGKLKAVVLELSLPQSCYATMALREVLREDTSCSHQSSLNVT